MTKRQRAIFRSVIITMGVFVAVGIPGFAWHFVVQLQIPLNIALAMVSTFAIFMAGLVVAQTYLSLTGRVGYVRTLVIGASIGGAARFARAGVVWWGFRQLLLTPVDIASACAVGAMVSMMLHHAFVKRGVVTQ